MTHALFQPATKHRMPLLKGSKHIGLRLLPTTLGLGLGSSVLHISQWI